MVDSYAVAGNNTEAFPVPFTQFPSTEISYKIQYNITAKKYY